MRSKSSLRWGSGLLLALVLVPLAWSFSFLRKSGQVITWNPGTVTVQLQLGSGTTLSDGTTYNSSVQAAMQTWNSQISTVQFVPQTGTTGAPIDNNQVNEIGFDSTVYGEAFDANVLAVTLSYSYVDPRSPTDPTYQRTQSDIVFNTAYTWDSYRGNLQAPEDIRRVALHELGHMLGLAHPDQATPPQNVTAIMNSTESNVDGLTADDIAGAQVLYGYPGGGSAPSISLQPANQSVMAGQTATFTMSAGANPAPTVQWQRLPAGGSTWTNLTDNGTYLNSTFANFAIYGTTVAMNGDQFRCVATNSLGSATTNPATLTVTSVPPSIYSNPASQTVYTGGSVTFNVGVSGTAPFNYQWRKNGSPISNATNASLTLSSVQLGDAGNYSVVVSNSAGSATSSDAILTVNTSTPPAISGLPASVTIDYYGSFSFSPSVTGTPSLAYQWKKDGVAISGATSSYFYKYNATQADAGSYTLTATNGGGSVTSSPVVVTVNASVPPAITQQPVGATVAKSFSASFSVSANGSNPIRYQWYLNGQAIPSATSSYYSISTATPANAGFYTVVVSNDSGSVTSTAVELVVLPAALPQINWTPYSTVINSSSNYFSFNPSVTGTTPMTYQWFKDGVAIPGATSGYYSKSSATASDAGAYSLVVSNEAGIAVSADAIVTWNASQASPWLDTYRLGDVVYFLATLPARIMRYDLAQEAWLPVVYLSETKVPTAFLPTTDGVFIAYNKDLVRRSVDLQTETPIVTSANPISTLFSYGSLVYFQSGSNVVSYNQSTLAAGPVFAVPGPWLNYNGLTRNARPVFSTTLASGFTTRPAVSPDDIIKFPVAGDGTFPGSTDSPYHGDYRVGSRQYLTANEQRLIDNSGVVYNTADLTYAASLGTAFDDLAFFSDGSIAVLRGQKLSAANGGSFVETGQYPLSSQAYNVFARGMAAYAFGAPINNQSNPVVTKVLAASFSPASPATPPNIANLKFSVDDLFIDSQGVVNLLSRSVRGIVRWDTQTRGFLATLPTRAKPTLASYAPAANRYVLYYSDGALTQFQLNSNTTEQVFANLTAYNTPFTLLAMDDLTFLNMHDAGSSGDYRFVLDGQGNSKLQTSALYYGAGLAWQSSLRRLYSQASAFSSTTVDYADVSASGVISSGTVSSVNNIIPPLRFRYDGALVLSPNGKILNSDLQQVGVLPNAVLDGAWLADGLYTIRARSEGTELQQWAPVVYSLTGSLTLPGIPLRVFRVSSTRLVVVTLINGYVAFHLVDTNRVLVGSSFNSTGAYLTLQPVSQKKLKGRAVTFTVAATGTPAPTYQWMKNGVNIPGATGASYTIANVAMTDAGTYSAVASNSAGSVTSTGAVLTVLSSLPSNDFDGDGMPDLLWQNTGTGQRSLWLMNGLTATGGVDLGTVPMEWVIAGTGDFTGDGKTDLLWQNTVTGQRSVWAMNGTTAMYGVDLGTVPLDWWIAGVGDFNADGKPDILWTNTVTNERAIWLMNGTTPISGVSLGIIPFEWSIAGAADFNLDGQTDILWSNVLTGERSIWLMNGTNATGGISLGIFTPSLQISGTGDYNGDGYIDILLSDQVSGARSVWLMNGTSIASTVSLGTVSPDWILNRPVPRHVPVDFNADSKSDIVWQNMVTGERAAWLMNGTTPLSGISLGTRSTDWEIAATGDFNFDGRADLVWQNNVTGERNIWLMNGATKLSEVALPTIPLDWKIRSTGDFNIDGAVDLLLQNTTTGECVVWFMNGATPTGGVSLGVKPLTMQIVGCGDFNADSKADIVWTDTSTGERSIWLMNGTAMPNIISLGVVPLQWEIVGTGDFDQDGNADLVWQNSATGERSIWLMNGTSPRSGVSLGTAPTSWSIRN